MRQAIKQLMLVLAIATAMVACRKTEVVRPSKPIPPIEQPGNGGGEQNNGDTLITIKVRAVIRIGEIVYDSLPTQLTIISWDAQSKARVQQIKLKAGVNEVQLHKDHLLHQLKLDKWGHSDELPLKKEDLNGTTTYILGGAMQAKKLRSEIEYVLVDGQYRPESKIEYQYSAVGHLQKVLYYKRGKDGRAYVSTTELIERNAYHVTSTTKFDSANTLLERTTFTYDQQGKIISLEKQESSGIKINGTVQSVATENGIETGIEYRYSHNNIVMTYNMVFLRGNLIMGTATNNYYNSEIGRYNHDLTINPYAHMDWPDIFLSRKSKNNVIWSQKEYFGAYPISDPVNYRYKYSGDGYPLELLKDHRSYKTGAILYTTKTTYHY